MDDGIRRTEFEARLSGLLDVIERQSRTIERLIALNADHDRRLTVLETTNAVQRQSAMRSLDVVKIIAPIIISIIGAAWMLGHIISRAMSHG